MSTVSDCTRDSLAVPPWSKESQERSKSDQYLAKRFAAASADLKAMALTTFLLAFAVAAVGWFVLGVLVEHWLVPGGLAGWARWAWFLAGGCAAVVAVTVWLVPLIRYRVNLVFAARELERGHPDLHNDLVNAVLVKERSGEAAEAIVKSLRRRAARRLSTVTDEGVVDRTPAVRLAWVLSALVCLVILYAVLAPKSFVASAARLAVPWSGMVPPSRVQITNPRLMWKVPDEELGTPGADRMLAIVDGQAELVRGRQLVVSTTIEGLNPDERTVLVVTPVRDDGTLDASLTPWQVTMAAGSGGIRTALLPGVDRGLDHGVEIQIVAGDGRSEPVRVAVIDAPTLLVRELRYDYPDYMDRESETLPWQGDIRGVEGTRVTIVAESNRPLDAAAIDLGCDGRRNISLALDKPAATSGKATFALELNADRTGPKYSAYRFIYRPKSSGGQPTEPDVISQLEHRIEVTPDLAPEVTIEVPEEKVLKVPPDAPVTVRMRAVDPDFGLARVHVETRMADGEIRRGDELMVGRPRLTFRGAATLVPQALGAKPGTKLEYRGVAIDTRPDKPNQTVTEWQVLEIDPSAAPQEQEQPPQGDPKGDGGKPQDQNQGQGKQDGQGQQGKGQPGDDRGDAGGDQKGDGKGESQKAEGDGEQGEGGKGQGQGPDGEGQEGNDPKGEGQQGQGEGQKGDGDKGQGQKGEGARGDGQEKGQENAQKGDGESEEVRGEKVQNQQGPGQGREGRGQQGQRPEGDGQQSEGQKGQGQEGQGQERQQGQGTDGSEVSRPKPSVDSDGTDDGEAIERILENRRQEGADESREGSSEGEAAGSEGGGQQQEQEKGQEQGGEHDGKLSGEQGDGQQQGQQGDGQTGDGQPDQGQPGQGKPQPGQGQDGQSNQGQPGEGQEGQGKQTQGQEGRGQSGDGQAGQDEQQGQGHPGDGQAGQRVQGSGENDGPSQNQQGEGQQGEGQKGEGQPDRPGEGQEGRGVGKQGQGAGEGSQPSGQSEQGGDQPPAGDGEGQGGQGGKGDASDGRGQEGEAAPLDRREMQWTDQDLDHARNAANLAMEHLRDALAKGRTDVIDDLGWTPEQARAFLDRWQKMQQLGDSGDATQRTEFEKAVRSLGLRPDGVQSSRAVPTDRKGGQAEGRRSKPPSDYREQFKAFMQGTSIE